MPEFRQQGLLVFDLPTCSCSNYCASPTPELDALRLPMVQLLARAVREVTPTNDLSSRMDEMRGAARRALDRAVTHVNKKLVDAQTRSTSLAPASLTLSRAYSPLHHGKFAAMIPGDSVAESVITSGLFSTLSIYNTLLIGRLILTWFPNPPISTYSEASSPPSVAPLTSHQSSRSPCLTCSPTPLPRCRVK